MDAPIAALIRTSRLVLRPWSAADAPAVGPVLEANVAHLGSWIPAHVAAPAALPALAERLAAFGADFADGREFRFAIVRADTGEVLGEADLFPRSVAAGRCPLVDADHIELGYWLAASATGHGYATEAAGALLDLAATLPALTHVEIRCDELNVPSAAVPLRLGFALDSITDGKQVWRRDLRLLPAQADLRTGGTDAGPSRR
jgi:RimJ/RimL family protein N-acetyltransferase